MSLNISKHLAIFNYVKIVMFMRDAISMTLEGNEMVFTRITWGELEDGATEFHLSYALILPFSLGMHSEKLTNGSLISVHLRT